MANRRKVIFTLLGLLGCLLIGVAIGVVLVFRNPQILANLLKPSHVVNSLDNSVVRSYLTADILPFKVAPNIYPSVKGWDTTLTLCENKYVRLNATGWISGEFTCQYSDEHSQRVIGHPGDYVYPCDMRFNKNNKRIYAKASGLAAGLYQDTIIYEFDTSSRKTITQIHVDPNILPVDPKL